jgi:hypothetical protein
MQRASGITSRLTEIATADAEDGPGIMTGRAGTLGTGVEGDRGLDVLMAKQLSNNLVLTGVAVEKDFGDGVPETVRGHVQPGVREHNLLDLAAQGTFALGSIGSVSWEEEARLARTKTRPPPALIQVEEVNRFLHERELEVVGVLHLVSWKTKVE